VGGQVLRRGHTLAELPLLSRQRLRKVAEQEEAVDESRVVCIGEAAQDARFDRPAELLRCQERWG